MHSNYDLVVLGGGVVGLWTAASAARLGARVAVIEIGPGSLAEQQASEPKLEFPERQNEGAVKARNQVLGGNSSYWGGGLVRNSRRALEDLYGPEEGARVAAKYDPVERALGVGVAFTGGLELAGSQLHEVAVLPGKKRGLWSTLGSQLNMDIFTNARIERVSREPGGRVDSIEFVRNGSARHRLRASAVALSMGVIDSNLFVLNWLADAVPQAVRACIGTRLHDHWSAPIASISWRNGTDLSLLFPPKFRGGVVVGRRLTLENGFFHIVADLDRMPPYDRVKQLLKVRQRGAGSWDVLRAAARTCASPFGMLRAAARYISKHELYIPDRSAVRLVADLESCSSARNRLVRSAHGAQLYWDVRDEDVQAYEDALREHRPYWEALFESAGVDFEWFEIFSADSLRSHLVMMGSDAFHLGGGLHPDYRGICGVAEPDGFLRGCPNVFINGTAFFCRPGPGNPVLTLLARAETYVENLSRRAAELPALATSRGDSRA